MKLETAYLVIRIIRILALVALFVMYYYQDKGKHVGKVTGVVISLCGLTMTIASIIFEVIFNASCLLAMFVLVLFGIISIVEIKKYIRNNRKLISKKNNINCR